MNFTAQFAQVRPAYAIPDHNLVGEVLVPAMRLSEEVRIEAGFFSSRCLAQVAPGLAAFINGTDGILQLLVSPEINDEDRNAIRRGIRDRQTVLNDTMACLFENARLSESAVEKHVVETLAYLVASERLQMRVVFMEHGMYHKKLWLFRSRDQWLAVHGSGNATERGLLVNGEQMSVDRAWMDGEQPKKRVSLFLSQWDKTWTNQSKTSMTVEVGAALEILRGYAKVVPPTTADFWEAWHNDSEMGLEPDLPSEDRFVPTDHRLKIPAGLVWRKGRFAHQGQAVDALLKGGGGILSIATGGGKTRTALIAVSEIQYRESGHLCIVIVASSTPLIRQWTASIREFGINPVVLSGISKTKRIEKLEQLTVAFGTTEPRTEVLLLTHALFNRAASPERIWMENLPEVVNRLLIADEVHNLGASGFVDALPEYFTFRIGLSATPIRQYDPDGTDRLFNFFGGPPVFKFSLGDAIESGCLVPYQYYIHIVQFDYEEMDYYEDLTQRLVQAGFQVNEDGKTIGLNPTVERLLRERRALVEQAGAKMNALKEQLKQMGPASIEKTLIYTSAKPTIHDKPKQITEVNRMLQGLHITSHQYTARETASSGPYSFLDGFASGDYQVLTAMKVLDEGIDIPHIDTAFLMASSTVEREWIQRRGRILRNTPGKNIAHLHDFIVTPPDTAAGAGSSLLKSELRRASAFADLAENEFDPGGPSSMIRKLESAIWKT